MASHVFKASFTKGELTPFAHARADIELYQQGAELLQNWCVKKYGGVFRRPSTSFLGQAKYPDRQARLIPFVFNSTGQAYQLEFGDGYIRFWIDYGQILDDAMDVLEIESPYEEDDLIDIQFVVDGDVMYIAHPRHFPRSLRRNSHNDWELTNLDFIDGPYLPINDTPTTITLDGTASEGADRTITFTYSGLDPFLTVADIGRMMRFQLDGFWWWATITAVTSDSICDVLIHKVNARTNEDEGSLGTPPVSASLETVTWRMGAFSAGKPAPVRTILTAGTSWSVPSDWNDNDNTIEVFGGGGGGRGAVAGGGGGGAYSRINNLDLTPSASIAYAIGAAGAAGTSGVNGGNGGDTYFNGASFAAASVGAKGGLGSTGSSGALGGQSSAGIGNVKFSGGNGAATSSGGTASGGGGGAAGPSGAGQNASTTTGGRANGGLGAAGGTLNNSGANGDEYAGTHGPGGGGGARGEASVGAGGNYGGGGGGGASAQAGGAGKAGLIVITYTPATAVLHDTPGYPGSICIFDNRVVWGRTNANPRAVFCSYAGLPLRYSPSDAAGTVTASHGFTFDLRAGLVDPILWLRDGQRIRIGTASAIRSLGSSDGTSAMGARNVSHRLEVPVGSSPAMPIEVGPALAFLARFGSGVHDLIFDYQTNSLAAPDLSVLAEHLFEGGALGLAFQDVPDKLLWHYDAEGGLYCTTVERNERVFAFSRHDVSGQVESISVIPTATRHELWLIVKRTINGSEVRYIEALEKVFNSRVDAIEDAKFLDCGATYEGAATNAVGGLEHLEGETVDAFADGIWYAGLEVTGGEIELPDEVEAEVIHVGLPIENLGTLLRAPAQGPDGALLGRRKKVLEIVVDCIGSMGIEVRAKNRDWQLLRNPKPEDLLGEPIPLYSGVMKKNVGDTWDGEGQVEFKVTGPYPAMIRAFNVQIESEP